MVEGHKIEKKVDVKDFLETIQDIPIDQIHTTSHTSFRLKKAEREIFQEKIIKEYLKGGVPILVGIQKNGNYAVFYKYGKDLLRMILEMQPNKIDIVTFYIIDKTKIPIIR